MSYEDDKKAIDDSIARVSEMASSLEEITKKVTGQEELTQTWKNEMGEIRKNLKEIKELNDNGGDNSGEKLKELVDKVNELSNNINNSSANAAQGGAGDDKGWDEKKLSKAVKDKADKLYKTLSPEQKAYIANNPKKREEFLKAAEESASTVPDSLFEEPAGEEATVNEFRNLFNKTGNDADHIPGSSGGGAGAGYAGADNSGGAGGPVITKQLPTGNIPRGKK